MSYACVQVKCNNFSHLPPREALISLYNCYKYSLVENAEWREIPGFPGYEISSAGQVRNRKSYGGKPRTLVPTLRFNKYFYVTLTSQEGKRIGVAIDRLMVSTFHNKSTPEIRRVMHEDTLRFNNRIENLTFTTWQ